MGGSSWIFNKHSSKDWYTLNLMIHCVASVKPSHVDTIIDKSKRDVSFFSLITMNKKMEYRLVGTRMLDNKLLESMDQ